MGLEEEAQRQIEEAVTQRRSYDEHQKAYTDQLSELKAEFMSVLRKRGINPVPVHTTRSTGFGFRSVNPDVIGSGWILSVGDDTASWHIVLMTDGTIRDADPPERLSKGEVRRFGIPRSYWPQGEFIGSNDVRREDNEIIKQGMVKFIAEH